MELVAPPVPVLFVLFPKQYRAVQGSGTYIFKALAVFLLSWLLFCSQLCCGRVMEGEEIELYIHAHATAEQRPYEKWKQSC